MAKKEIYIAILKAQKEINKILCNDQLSHYRNKIEKTTQDEKRLSQILDQRKPFEKVSILLEDARQKLAHLWY